MYPFIDEGSFQQLGEGFVVKGSCLLSDFLAVLR